MRALIVILSIFIGSIANSAFAQTTLPTPPFNQCPAVGQDTSCAILLVIDTDGSLRVVTDPSQGPYDGTEDTLVGVQNNSNKTVLSIPLKGAQAIFSFEADGICGTDPNTGQPFQPRPAGCPFGPTTYEGPGVSFSSINANSTSGTVNFAGGIPPGGSAYFSLEENIQTQCAPLSVPLMRQFSSPWATETYDHSYRTRNYANATSTAVSTTGSMELVVFPTGRGQANSGTPYAITLTAQTNNLNGLRDAINALGNTGVTATVTSSANGSAVLTLSAGQGVNSVQLRGTPGAPGSNLLTNIRAKGCFLTSSAMVVNYWAAQQGSSFSTTPELLNDYLNDRPNGYIGASVNGTEVALYARQHGISLYYNGPVNKRDDLTLDSYLCSGQPVLLQVREPHSHFVAATGQTTVNNIPTYSINDPGHNNTTLQGYNYTYSGLRLYNSQPTAPSALYVVAHSPVELVVSDASGRRTGLDPRTGQQLQDIPASGYGLESLEDDVDPTTSDPTPEIKVFDAMNPASGNYKVQAFGTGNGPYTLDFIAYDSAGNQTSTTVTGNAVPGSVTTYQVAYSSIPGRAIQVQLVANLVPPTITGMPPTGCTVWPVNHKLMQVATIGASDNSGTGLSALNVAVTSNEPDAGGSAPQFVINGNTVGPKTVQLRADRLGAGSGRTYTITATAQDNSGDVATATATCTVPHDQGRR